MNEDKKIKVSFYECHQCDYCYEHYEEGTEICTKCGKKFKQELPVEVENQLDVYIKRIENIKWFQPNLNLQRKEIDEHINNIFRAFNVNGPIEYRQIKNIKDGVDAQDIIREATWESFTEMTHQTARRYTESTVWGDAYGVGFTALYYACGTLTGNVNDAVSGQISASVYAKKTNWFNALSAVYHLSKEIITNREDQFQSCDAIKWAMNCAKKDAQFGLCDILALNIKDYKKIYSNGNFINIIPLWEAGLYPIGMVDGKFIVYVPAVDGEFPSELK